MSDNHNTGPSITPPIVVEIDVPVTRRIKIHAVVDGDGDQVFHSKRISQVFAYLLDNDVHAFTILDEDDEFSVILARPLPRPQTSKG